MFLKLLVRIVEVLSKDLVLISQMAALNFSDTIYPHLWLACEKRLKLTFFHEK